MSDKRVVTAADITYEDVARLVRWMADGGWHTTDDIAYAIEKPWKYADEIEALRAGNEPDEGDEA